MTPRLTHSKGHQTWVEEAVAQIVSVEVTDGSVVLINTLNTYKCISIYMYLCEPNT